MTRDEVIARLKGVYLVDTGTIRVSVKSYKDNVLAPEETAYKVSFNDVLSGRRTVTLWPNTVGFQG